MNSRKTSDYRAAVLVSDGATLRRAVQIEIKGNDVYVFQPRKRRPNPHTSYHQSGRYHVRIDPGGQPIFPRQKTPVKALRHEEPVYVVSVDNFSSLLQHKGEQYDASYTVDLDRLPEGLPVLQVSVGGTFCRRKGYQQDDYREQICHESVLRQETPRVYLRVIVLSDPRTPSDFEATDAQTH
jgi:hypothetical protein